MAKFASVGIDWGALLLAYSTVRDPFPDRQGLMGAMIM